MTIRQVATGFSSITAAASLGSVSSIAHLYGVSARGLVSSLVKAGRGFDSQQPFPGFEANGYYSCGHQSRWALTTLYRGEPRAELNMAHHVAALVLRSDQLYVSEHQDVITAVFDFDEKWCNNFKRFGQAIFYASEHQVTLDFDEKRHEKFNKAGQGHYLMPIMTWLTAMRDHWRSNPLGREKIDLGDRKRTILKGAIDFS